MMNAGNLTDNHPLHNVTLHKKVREFFCLIKECTFVMATILFQILNNAFTINVYSIPFNLQNNALSSLSHNHKKNYGKV